MKHRIFISHPIGRRVDKEGLYKELERIVRLKGINLNVDKVLNIAKTITTVKVKLRESKEVFT